MHFLVSTFLALSFPLFPFRFFSTQLLPAKPAVQHVTLAPSVAGRGATLTLQLDITPKARVHVYGPGAKSFVQPSLKITPQSGLSLGKAGFPAPELVLDPVLKERIPMYSKTFRILQPVTLGGGTSSDDGLTVEGVLSYQACDDTMCYAPAMAPVSWVVRAR